MGLQIHPTHNRKGAVITILRTWIIVFGLVILTAQSGLASSDTVLRFIRHYEAPAGYDSYYTGIPKSKAPPKPLTQMTVGQVMKWQAGLSGVKSTAAGGYQFIQKTLADTVRDYNIDQNALFGPALQDRLARLLIRDCSGAYKRGPEPFANCLAGIWAALPLVTGKNKGKSVYHGIAGNKARVGPVAYMAVLKGAPFTAKSSARARRARAAALPKIYGNGAVKISRYAMIKDATQKIRETGATGRSVVYTRDPYAQD